MADFDAQLPIRSDAAEAAVNVEQLNGNTASTGSGTVDSGTLRVTQATDVPVNVDVDSLAGTAISTNTGTVDAGTQRVTLATDVPVPVDISGIDKVNVVDYDTASAVAAAGSDTHQYDPSANFKLTSISFSCSGQGKVEIKWGATASEVTKNVGFVSKANNNYVFKLDDPVLLTASDTILVVRTNTEPGQAQDLYSTIQGYDA